MLIPPKARAAFDSQRKNANRRGIEFRFSFEDWWAWWQLDGRWARRGRTRDALVMARFGDEGPYELGNVYCATTSQNVHDTSPAKLSEANSAAWCRRKRGGDRGHLAVRGDGHPRSKPVVTPAGRFGSAALAGEHYGISRPGAKCRADRQIEGWRWAD